MCEDFLALARDDALKFLSENKLCIGSAYSQGRIKGRGARGRLECGAPKLWNAKTTNSDLGRARKRLGATNLVDLNDRSSYLLGIGCP